jgi:hypothetical protein
MTAHECVREAEILDEIAEGRWPAAAPAALREHAPRCPVCADLALTASALHDDAPDAHAAPLVLPSAGQVWWRAELRARHEAARLAQRPVLAVQVVAAVVLLAAVVTGVRSLAPGAWAWLVQTADAARGGGLATMDTWTLTLVLSVGLWLVLGPIAVLMVLRADRQGGR